MNRKRLKEFCKDCPTKKMIGFTRCPYGNRKEICAEYKAFRASLVLEDTETANLVPVDLLLKALRVHGYTGELRKTMTVTI